jgi:hypothetical protein
MEETDGMLEELWHSFTDREVYSWSWEREMLATIAELLHAMYRQQMAIWGAKSYEIPKPLQIDRPHPPDLRTEEEREAEEAEAKAKAVTEVLTAKQFAMWVRLGMG